jgi:hypothetical protein
MTHEQELLNPDALIEQIRKIAARAFQIVNAQAESERQNEDDRQQLQGEPMPPWPGSRWSLSRRSTEIAIASGRGAKGL